MNPTKLTLAVVGVMFSQLAAAYEATPLPPGLYVGASVELKDMKESYEGVPPHVTPIRFRIDEDYMFDIHDSTGLFPPLFWQKTEWRSEPDHGMHLQLFWERVNGIIVIHFYMKRDKEVIAASKFFCREIEEPEKNE
jgi:hypothetical protein